MSTLYGISSTIGAEQLLQGGTITTNVSISGATVGMTVTATPEIYPGPGITWEAYVSAPNVVTLKVSTILAGGIREARYFVGVNTDTGGGSGVAVVASADFSDQSGNLAFDLYTPTAPGEFSFDDSITLNATVAALELTYTVTYSDGTTTQTIGPNAANLQPGPMVTSATGLSLGSFTTNLILPNDLVSSVPATIHAAPGSPIHVAVTAAFADPTARYDLHITLLQLR